MAHHGAAVFSGIIGHADHSLGRGGVAIAVAVSGTVVGGRFCTGPDVDGCEDRYSVNGDRDPMVFDQDWYGWPVKWKTDMSPERFESKTTSLINPWGVSVVHLAASLGVWFTASGVVEGLALGLYGVHRRAKRVRPATRSPAGDA